MKLRHLTILAAMISASVSASEISQSKLPLSDVEQCVLDKMKYSVESKSYIEWKAKCDEELEINEPYFSDISTDSFYSEENVYHHRIVAEASEAFEPYTLMAHQLNYFMPVYTSSSINRAPYDEKFAENLSDMEAKFQVSMKIPLNTSDMLFHGDKLYFGFTVSALWQIYADNISKPFREVDYSPEMFYMTPTNLHPFGGSVALGAGLIHQSNGMLTEYSRSWNRIYGMIAYQKGNFAMTMQPWYRIPEDAKTSVDDDLGDDNPDILDYMGYYKMTMAYKYDESQMYMKVRSNFETGKGAVELNYLTPIWGKLNLYLTAFRGYGASLIDYNHLETRVGVGVAFNRIF